MCSERRVKSDLRPNTNIDMTGMTIDNRIYHSTCDISLAWLEVDERITRILRNLSHALVFWPSRNPA
jgi:hypothetical protein